MGSQSIDVPNNPVGANMHPSLQASLVMDVALGVDDETIMEAYGFQAHQLEHIKHTPLFQAELKRVTKQLNEDGASFRLKAAIQAEAMLDTSWSIVHNAETPRHVAADLIKATVRWAGHDGGNAQAAAAGAGFSININLGGGEDKSTSFTIEHGDDDGDA